MCNSHYFDIVLLTNMSTQKRPFPIANQLHDIITLLQCARKSLSNFFRKSMNPLFRQKTKSIKAIGFTPEQLTDDPVLQRTLTQRDVIALEQLHLLLSKIRLLSKERLTREGLNHINEIADVGYRIPLHIRTGNESLINHNVSSSNQQFSRYDRELLMLNSLLYQKLDHNVMYESKTSILRDWHRKLIPIISLVSIFSGIGFLLGRAFT